ELTIVLDCCRAASMVRPDGISTLAMTKDPSDPDIDLDAFSQTSLDSAIQPRSAVEERSTNRGLLAASRANGRAFTSPDAPYSVFTGHMLDCLRGADAESTGGTDVTIAQLFAYIQKHVQRDSGGGQHALLSTKVESLYTLTRYPQPIRRVDHFDKDVFISYHRDDLALDDWVKNLFQPELENNGISIWDHDDLAARKLDVRDAIAR